MAISRLQNQIGQMNQNFQASNMQYAISGEEEANVNNAGETFMTESKQAVPDKATATDQKQHDPYGISTFLDSKENKDTVAQTSYIGGQNSYITGPLFQSAIQSQEA